MKNLNLYVVPPHHTQQFWHLAEPHLARAIAKGNGEFIPEQLKLLVSQGQQTLLLVMDDDKKCHCALTVQWTNFPNDRVCYINYIGGHNTKGGWEQFKTWVRNNGGTSIQGSTAYDSIVKLWNRLYGFNKKYTLMELKL